MRTLVAAILASLGLACGAARAAEETPPAQAWSFEGVLGAYDRQALQRGYQIYKEVCSSCHSLRLLSYRNLGDIGFSDAEVKALAAQDQVPDVDDAGDPTQRPARPSDRFKSPFANEKQARAANGGALPPDLSLIVKAREYGPDYVYAILTGYRDAPQGFQLNTGKYYNEYFSGHQISMPPPLSDDRVAYSDGTKASLSQEAHDVVSFLTWAAEPKLEERHRTGIKVMAFLGILSVFLYLCFRRIRARVHGH